MLLINFLLFITVFSELSSEILSDLNTHYSQIDPKNPPFNLLEELYIISYQSNTTEALFLSNSTDSHILSLHYFKTQHSPFNILENSSPLFEPITNVSISDIEKLYKLKLTSQFKTVKLVQAQVQKIPQFERRFSLVGVLYIADGNIYYFFAVLDKHSMIKSYTWALSSNKVKTIETSSMLWEIVSFMVSSLTCALFIYLFWLKNRKFPFNSLPETQARELEMV